MPFWIEPCNLTDVPGTHHQLMADDELTDRQRFLDRQTHPLDGFLGPSHLAHEVVDGNVREVLDEVLGQRRPVRMGLAAARKRVRAGHIGWIHERSSWFCHWSPPGEHGTRWLEYPRICGRSLLSKTTISDHVHGAEI